jgi:hypothetical protein
MWDVRSGARCLAGLCAAAGVSIAAPAAAEPEGESSKVAVEFTADHANAALERHREESGTWRGVCIAPCRRKLDSSVSYRVRGAGVIPSDAFYLPSGREGVTLHAEVATRGERTFAAVMAVGGGIVALNGLGILAAGAFMNSAEDSGSDFSGTGDTLVVVGGVTLALGLVAGIYGLANLFDKTETHVSLSRPPRVALPFGLEATPGGIAF